MVVQELFRLFCSLEFLYDDAFTDFDFRTSQERERARVAGDDFTQGGQQPTGKLKEKLKLIDS